MTRSNVSPHRSSRYAAYGVHVSFSRARPAVTIPYAFSVTETTSNWAPTTISKHYDPATTGQASLASPTLLPTGTMEVGLGVRSHALSSGSAQFRRRSSMKRWRLL